MNNLMQTRGVRAVIGVAFLALTGACADLPSSPTRFPSNPTFPNPPASRSGEEMAHDASLPVALAGETVKRRDVRSKDGARYTIESLVDGSGLPRELRVLRNGRPVARLTNQWSRTAAGMTLERQRLVRFVSGGAPVSFDSRDRGGVSALAQGPFLLTRSAVTTVPSAPQGAVGFVRLKSVEGEYVPVCEACEAQARAVEAALDEWLLSVLAMGGATMSGNVFLAWSAYAYQLKKYRDLMRLEGALDDCVEDAGKPYEA